MIHCFGCTAQFKEVHDKVGDVAKFCARLMAKNLVSGCVCQTAFDFYKVVKLHSKGPADNWFLSDDRKLLKHPLEATKYYTFYVASSPDDALGKSDDDDVFLTLNRPVNMWNSTVVVGSHNKYEFRSIMSAAAHRGDGNNLWVRKRPCPCTNCDVHFEECNRDNGTVKCKLSCTVPAAAVFNVVKLPVRCGGGGSNSDAASSAGGAVATDDVEEDDSDDDSDIVASAASGSVVSGGLLSCNADCSAGRSVNVSVDASAVHMHSCGLASAGVVTRKRKQPSQRIDL